MHNYHLCQVFSIHTSFVDSDTTSRSEAVTVYSCCVFFSPSFPLLRGSKASEYFAVALLFGSSNGVWCFFSPSFPLSWGSKASEYFAVALLFGSSNGILLLLFFLSQFSPFGGIQGVWIICCCAVVFVTAVILLSRCEQVSSQGRVCAKMCKSFDKTTTPSTPNPVPFPPSTPSNSKPACF